MADQSPVHENGLPFVDLPFKNIDICLQNLQILNAYLNDAESQAEVGIIMGSDSDLSTMRAAAKTLQSLGVKCEVTIVSAHRTPERMMSYARSSHTRGLKVKTLKS